MARRRKKKALYEVMGETRPKADADKPDAPGSSVPLPGRLTQWPRKPKIVQFNAGRIEFSMPYELGIALVMVLVLLVLVFFRLGQSVSSEEVPAAFEAGQIVRKVEAATEQMLDEAEEIVSPPDFAEKAEEFELVTSKANNRIVIQTYRVEAHLEPVRDYFAQFSIETEIKRIGDWYYLVTEDKYENPEKPGTDGYRAKQGIIDLGASYIAPTGFDSFGRKPFHDAYGKRFDD